MKKASVCVVALLLALLCVAQSLCAEVDRLRDGGDHRRSLRQMDTDAKRCACLFDVDSTIYLPDSEVFRFANPFLDGEVAPEAGEAVSACKDIGFDIGIATLNCFPETVKDILRSVNSTIFTDEFLESEWYQDCNLIKATELQRILDAFDLDPQCVVLIDNDYFNSLSTLFVGMNFQIVDPDIGVTLEDAEDAIEKVREKCTCKTT